jgi:hypothetical protein
MANMALKNNYRPELKDGYLVVFILAKVVDHLFNCKLVPFNNPGNAPDYPYVTYHPIIPLDYTTADHRTDQFYEQLQIDCHAVDPNMAQQMATDLLNALVHSDNYQRWFDQVNVVPSALPDAGTKIQDHTSTLLGPNYDNMYGFYFDFLISQAGTVYQADKLNFDFSKDEVIESIRTNSQVDGDHIDAKKEET